ncbi:DUF1080 domain-containing protein [Ktedonosporobacter rubrisoli]|uniref:DUF1080 domain-containing protein n=1 Tax=Ktedonosporobacter rubrisoli TaxID=2509675 RepID=A0A4P6JRK7_KTERU|nr:family 16 glycoside hydrolase [Ktedonosporobacter rubrisoli]QBD77842.1 DUF1080 domain-containing protein [Ktedonosporobacter rubrisoli]
MVKHNFHHLAQQNPPRSLADSPIYIFSGKRAQEPPTPRGSHPHTQKSRFTARKLSISGLLLAIYLIFSLGACSQTPSSPSQTSHPTPTQVPATPTATKAPTTLYQADWSHGLDGWQHNEGWTVVNGQLAAHNTSASTIIVPYQPSTSNYVIEANVRITHVLKPIINNFFIFSRNTSNKDGFEAEVMGLNSQDPKITGYAGFAQILTNQVNVNAGVEQIDFAPSTNWRTYRVEVQGDETRFIVDGTEISKSISRMDMVSTGPLGLSSMGLDVEVSSFKITTL